MQVTAAVAVGAGQPFEIKTLELDDPRDDEVLVRIVGVGVCHTDIVFKESQAIAPPTSPGTSSGNRRSPPTPSPTSAIW